jgi:hypothetical protein
VELNGVSSGVGGVGAVDTVGVINVGVAFQSISCILHYSFVTC